MNVALRSDKVTLISEDEFGGCEDDKLWRLFRRTAVDPGQASSPDFGSFADECLLCTHIVVNPDKPSDSAEDERENNEESLCDAGPPEEHTSTPSLAEPLPPSAPVNQRVGLIYLYAGPANLPAGEANIGVIIRQDVQQCGYAREAVQLVLRWAFEELKFHRVQAPILDTPFKDKALRLFIGSGFAHEGTKRRAVYQPEGEGMAGIWKDVTYLAMLDTEWMLRSMCKRRSHVDQPVVSLWDEIFARHSREREELLRWEEKHGRMKRSSSMETLRENTRNATLDMAYLTDDAASSMGGSTPPSPRSDILMTWEDAYMTDDPDPDGLDQTWEEVMETAVAARHQRGDTGGSLLMPSLLAHRRALPSIPSTGVSEGIPQSPLTISTPSTPRSVPPRSLSPSARSSGHNSWAEEEDEDDWLLRETSPPASVPVRFMMPHGGPCPRPGPGNLRRRSRSSSPSASSTDTWSDAQSSIGASSSNWDLISNTSVHGHPGGD